MKILIATPLYPPQVGGPAKYAKSLAEEFERQGHKARVVAYGRAERALPPGLRHVWYALRLLRPLRNADAVLAMDTWSVGLPTLWVSRLWRKRMVIRIGGDALWEEYVDRTKEMVKLSEFYAAQRHLTLKERLMYKAIASLAQYAVFAFNSVWQQSLWTGVYGLRPERTTVVSNLYPAAGESVPASGKIFVVAGRDNALKNKQGLHEAFERVRQTHPDIMLDEETLPPERHTQRIKSCYAVIIPSISEVNPNSAIEAAAARKPFIAPEDCGGKDALAGMGLFVNTASAQALAAGMERLLDPDFYQSCVEASAELRPRAWNDVAREFLALLAGGNDKAGTNAAQKTG